MSADPHWPPDALADDFTRPPTESLLRLWELFTATAATPGAGVRVADAAELGRLHVWDYLFTSADTLVAGARLAAERLPLLVDPSAAMTVREDGALLTIGYSSETAWTAAADGIHEFIMALILRRSRETVGRDLIPVHVGFAHDAPRTHRHLIDAFGHQRRGLRRPDQLVDLPHRRYSHRRQPYRPAERPGTHSDPHAVRRRPRRQRSSRAGLARALR
ncbi:MAG: hypothetical protein HOV87_05830 [Catenulispora sp.]|nr:hypothetical protein [Catenulispora sp.]